MYFVALPCHCTRPFGRSSWRLINVVVALIADVLNWGNWGPSMASLLRSDLTQLPQPDVSPDGSRSCSLKVGTYIGTYKDRQILLRDSNGQRKKEKKRKAPRTDWWASSVSQHKTAG
jgi:hypothetical protein